ncbi:MAG: sigma factor-like helix-turn-helix DNA-binding protein [Actinomycetota bacterium]
MRERDAEFTWFFHAEYPQVVRTVHLVMRDAGRAEDVAQEAFLTLYARWPRIARYERPDLWVRRIAIRLAVRASGREGMRAQREREAPAAWPAPGPAPADPDLMRAIRALSSPLRVAVVLFYFEDRPASEIAKILGCAESTARVHLVHARARLAELLSEHGEETTDVP